MAIKQVTVIRKDLGMRRGKEITQGAHASQAWAIKALESLLSGAPVETSIAEHELEWMRGLHTKITLVVNSEVELMEIYEKASQEGLETNLVIDAGKTEFNGIPTKTCLAIGPNETEEIDNVTGHLKLY